MKVISVIFVFFGLLFFLMGFNFEPMFPALCLGLLFFAIAGLFWRNSVEYHDDMGLIRGNSKSPSGTFVENKKILEQIRKFKNK